MGGTTDAIAGGIGAVVGLGVMSQAMKATQRRTRRRKKVRVQRARAKRWSM